MLRTSFQKQLDSDAGQAVGQRILANDFGQILTVGRTGILGVRHDKKKAHADFVPGFAGLEVDAGARDADGAAHIVEMGALGIGGPNAHQLSELAAAAGATLGLSAFRGRQVRGKFIHVLLKGSILKGHRLLESSATPAERGSA
jgi:hypothetical protein